MRNDTGREETEEFHTQEAENGEGEEKKKDKKTNSTSVYINDTTFVDTRCAFNLHRGKA